MKKILLLCFAVTLFILATPITHSQYNDLWEIMEFNQDIEIKKDGKVLITETIIADFTKQTRRGPIRMIPINYDDNFGNPFNVRFNLISVTDENGNPHPVNKVWNENDYVNIRIGEPDVYLNEVTTYVLTYELNRVIGYFDQHDELYLNAFTEWDVPVLASEVTVTLPEEANQEDLQAVCYTGYFGESLGDCSSEIIDGKTFKFTMDYVAEPYEGFTIVAGFPKGMVEKPSFIQELSWWIIDNWALIIPIFVFIFLFLKWWISGRDPKTRDTIYPRYKPPEGLTPTEVGTIIDEKIDIHDIISVIINYAVKGYIKIVEQKKKSFFTSTYDYQLEKLKDYSKDPEIKGFEKEILNDIFEKKEKVMISSLKYKFYKKLPNIKKKLYKAMISDGYLVHNPDNVRAIYFGIGIAIVSISLTLMGAIIMALGLTAAFSIIASGILFIAFAKIMPRKTLKGANAYYEILGLEEYIRTAEKDRIKFQEDKNLLFEKLLPYAMVLGLAEKWGEAFKDIYKKPPNWFLADDMSNFNTNYLINRLNNFSSSTTTALASSPRSSGGSGGSSAWGGGSGFSGGFSGGGFGGGGGSSW